MNSLFFGRTCCFTSFSYAYLGRAVVLAESIRAAHPGWLITAVLVDQPPPGIDLSPFHAQFDCLTQVTSLDIPDLTAWLFKHDVVEACTAVKGAMLRLLLRGGASKVFYIDPDIALFHGLDEISDKLDLYSIVLTPHQVQPEKDQAAIRDNELASLRYGVFNLGFLAIRNDSIGRDFAEWWHSRLLEACYDDPASGIFTDQKYCDLVPSLFDGVHVHRDPGCNVASWNLSGRRITIEQTGDIRVNGSLLKFYHFTKIGGPGDVMTERYGADNLDVFEIWSWYRRRIAQRAPLGIMPDYWFYSAFADGRKIPKAAREHFRTLRDAFTRFPDPFAIGEGSYRNWLAEHHPSILDVS